MGVESISSWDSWEMPRSKKSSQEIIIFRRNLSLNHQTNGFKRANKRRSMSAKPANRKSRLMQIVKLPKPSSSFHDRSEFHGQRQQIFFVLFSECSFWAYVNRSRVDQTLYEEVFSLVRNYSALFYAETNYDFKFSQNWNLKTLSWWQLLQYSWLIFDKTVLGTIIFV